MQRSPTFIITPPQLGFKPRALVLDSPHSGIVEPSDFAYICSKHELQKGVDWWVDELVAGVCAKGGTLLTAQIARAYIDLNRSLADFDPDLCADVWPYPVAKSPRVRFGMGLLRSKVQANAPVYDRKLTRDEIRHRIEHYYTPYHSALRDLLDEAFEMHGQVLHINCHSTPSTLLNGQGLPDIIVGDRDGQTCSLIWRDLVVKYLRQQGLSVAVNNPYKGVELVRRFANPKIGRHSLQLEINKKLYMCEQSFEKRPNNYAQIQAVLNGLWAHLGQQLELASCDKIAAE